MKIERIVAGDRDGAGLILRGFAIRAVHRFAAFFKRQRYQAVPEREPRGAGLLQPRSIIAVRLDRELPRPLQLRGKAAEKCGFIHTGAIQQRIHNRLAPDRGLGYDCIHPCRISRGGERGSNEKRRRGHDEGERCRTAQP